VFGVAPAVTPITAVRLIATLLATVFSRLTVRAAGLFLSFFARSARLTVRAASLFLSFFARSARLTVRAASLFLLALARPARLAIGAACLYNASGAEMGSS
jgi:hypothetical protein